MSNFSILFYETNKSLPFPFTYYHRNVLQLRIIEQETNKAGLEIQLCKLMIEQDQVYAIPNVTISFSIIRSAISMICFVMWSIWLI